MAKNYTVLNVGDVVNVQVNMTPIAAARRSFGVLLIVGDSDVIDHGERIRYYTNGVDDVRGDFGGDAPEYKAAALYFSQVPQPYELAIGRWVSEAVAGYLKGGILTTAEKDIALWQAVTDGGFTIQVDGADVAVSTLDFSAATNLNGIATIIGTALGSAATIEYDGSRFTVRSATTGAASTVNYATQPASGTDVSAMLKLTTAFALEPVSGADAESFADAVAKLADVSQDWYGITPATAMVLTQDDILDVAGFIEASEVSRIFGVTETSTQALDPTYVDDIPSKLKVLGYNRSFTQYSSSTPYAVASIFGRAFSTNFNANNSLYTMKFKQQPGVAYEQLTRTQARALKDKNCNVFVYYNTDQAIVQEGVMASGVFFDEMHGLDWLKNAVEIELWNVLYSSRKVPQTNAGMNVLATVCKQVCEEAIFNGLLAAGTWNAEGFGQLERGMEIPGYYIFFRDINLQAQSEREQRIAPPIQIAVKLAGAIHFADVVIDVNR